MRGGWFIDVVAALGLIGAMIILLINDWGLAFQPNPHLIVPPHLQWLYVNNYQPGQFGYGKVTGPGSIRVRGMTKNAGSDKKDPSSGSYDYIDVMGKLDKQSNKKIVEIEVGNQIYIIKNPYRENAYELSNNLADQIYDSIRECDTDICDIAENLGFKADNIKNVKDHVFYQKHELDQYVSLGEASEYKRFDPYIQQALAWKRLETGTHTQDDILGVSFDESNSNKIEILQWPVEKGYKIQTSKEEVLEQVLSGLESVNKSLDTSYKLSKIYFLPSDRASNSVYKLLICKLIRHYHDGKEFKEI